MEDRRRIAAEALGRVGEAAQVIRDAEVTQAVALVRLAESYTVAVDDVVEVLAEKLVFPGDDGTPGVSEFLSLELGAALGMTQRAATELVADVLNLKHRLPLVWRAFCAGLLPRWQAIRLAHMTGWLGVEGAHWVDARLASRVGRVSYAHLKRVLRGLVAQADPEQLALRERRARDARGVHVAQMKDGSTDVFASLAPFDATALDRTIAQVACAFGEAGDERPLQQRRAAALGLLADPAAALSWLAGTTAPDGSARPPRAERRRSIVYVHLPAGTLADPATGVVRIEGFGPLSVESLPEFLSGSHVTVRPVVDEAGVETVDSYEIPSRIRDSVHRRHPTERFPFSARSARGLDLDHVLPYRRNAGLQGQTGVHNLAPMSRLVHRAKTLGAWRVRAGPRGSLEWTSPLGLGYTVAANGVTGPPRASPLIGL